MMKKQGKLSVRHSDFVVPSCFVIPHSFMMSIFSCEAAE